MDHWRNDNERINTCPTAALSTVHVNIHSSRIYFIISQGHDENYSIEGAELHNAHDSGAFAECCFR